MSIGEKAFYKCIKLETIVLPESLKTIGNYAFYRCDELKNVDLGGAKTIGSFAFYANYQIRELIIPKSVTSIGKQAFRNCQGLKSVLLSSGVTNVEQHAFYGCSSLTLYVDFTTVPETWHKYWNSSYRPVVYGCVFAGDNEYLSYIEVGTISNLNMANYISDPVREGYKFVGWGDSSTTTTPAYTSSNLSKATPGIKLYAIWSEK